MSVLLQTGRKVSAAVNTERTENGYAYDARWRRPHLAGAR